MPLSVEHALHQHDEGPESASPTPAMPKPRDVSDISFAPIPGIGPASTLRRLSDLRGVGTQPQSDVATTSATATTTTVNPVIRRSPETAELAKKGQPATPAVLPDIDDDKLYNIASDLYKGTHRQKGLIGDGTTMDAIRYEMATGNKTRGRGHEQKGEEYLNALYNWQKRAKKWATDRDWDFSNKLIDDLEAALDGN